MIYFLRHGSTDWNENLNNEGKKDPKCQGRFNLHLNDKGKKQALEVKKELNEINFDKIICSPLIRAKETLSIAYEGTAPIIYDNRIIERDFGEFEGLTRSEFDFNAFWNIYSEQKFNKAESILEVQNRVFNLLDELSINSSENILIVAHGGVGLVLMSYFEGIPEDGNYLNFELGTGKLKKFDFEKIKKDNYTRK